jgi:HK97 family phage prohead protease
MKKETRVLSTTIECRSEGDKRTITGHAAVFNRDSEVLYGSFIERIAPGAFAESIAKPDDVRALINHDGNLILGRNLSGTLQLREDEQGLHVTIDPPKTSYAQDLMESMQRGDVTQMSFGFETIEDKWTRGENGAPDIRTLLKVRLFDVSPVTFPAYPDTDVAVRSHEQFVKQQPAAPVDEVEIRRRRNELEAIAI